MENLSSLESLFEREDIPDDAKIIIKRSIAQQKAEREIAQRYRTLYKEVPIGLYRTTADGQILEANPYLVEMLGQKSLEDLKALDLEKDSDRFHPSYPRSEFKQRIEKDGIVRGLEASWQKKDGTFIYVRENAKAIRDDSGRIMYYEGSAEDITDKKTAEDEHIKIKARLEYLLTSSPVVIYSCVPRGNYPTTFMSANIKEILGYKPSDFIDNPTFWESKIHPEERALIVDNFKRISDTSYYSEVYRTKHKNGTYHWMLEEANLIRNETGEPIEIIGSWTDITERREAEEQLRQSEKRFRELVETSPDAITLTDLEGKIIMINNRGINLLGYEKHELIGMNGFELISPKDRELALENLIKTLELGRMRNLEYIILRKDGSSFPVEMSSTVIYDDQGNPENLMATIRDITERKKAQEMRAELERSRDNFIWTTSHELRTPITVLAGYTDLLQKQFETLDRDQLERILKVMANNIDRLERLSTNVTMVSKIDRGMFEVTKKERNLFRFLKEAVEAYEHLLGEQFEFSARFDQSFTIEIDKERIQQVIDNIMNNAIKNTHPDHRKIEMTVIDRPSDIRIIITDNGAGIDPSNLTRIFDQFVSIETEYSATGTGIGLFLSREIMDAHGGTITAHSEGLNCGSKFIISLSK